MVRFATVPAVPPDPLKELSTVPSLRTRVPDLENRENPHRQAEQH